MGAAQFEVATAYCGGVSVPGGLDGAGKLNDRSLPAKKDQDQGRTLDLPVVLSTKPTRPRTSGTSSTTQVGDFRSAKIGPRGSLQAPTGTLPRIKSNPDLVAVAVRPPFFNARGRRRNAGRVSIKSYKTLQAEKLAEFRRSARPGKWNSIHAGCHYDWFLFPIEDGSKAKFNVLADDVQDLLGDEGWVKGFVEAVELVAKAWGWDVHRARMFEPLEAGMKWTFWDVRLAKMIRCLWLFGFKDLMESMQAFARTVKPQGGLRYGRIKLDEVFFMVLPHAESEPRDGAGSLATHTQKQLK